MSKSLKIKSLLFIFASLVLFAGNFNLVQAAGDYGISETITAVDKDPSVAGSLKEFKVDVKIGEIIGYALSFVGLIFLLLIIYGGFMWMTAGGDSAKVEKAIHLFTQASIGLAIISAAYLITQFMGNLLI